MADAATETPAPPVKKSGGLVGTLVNGIGVFTFSLGAVIAGGFVNAKLHPIPEFKLGPEGKITAVEPVAAASHGEEAAKASAYFAIDPPLVVNFEDGSVVRFLQITMEVKAASKEILDSVQRNIPMIRNNLLLLMSNRNYQSLMSREGKEQLRKEALAEVRAVQKKAGGPDVDDVLFTSFVVQ